MSPWLPKISDDYMKMSNIAKNIPRCSDDLWALPKLFKRQPFLCVVCDTELKTSQRMNCTSHSVCRRQYSCHSFTIQQIKKTEFSYLTRSRLQLHEQEIWYPASRGYIFAVWGGVQKSSLCRQQFKFLQKSGRINVKNRLFPVLDRFRALHTSCVSLT